MKQGASVALSFRKFSLLESSKLNNYKALLLETQKEANSLALTC